MIVVTGGTGLVGSHLLLSLAKANNAIRALIRPGSDPKKILAVWNHYTNDPDSLFERIDWYTVDLLNRASLAEALQGAHQVYHCAARVSFDPRRKSEIWNANVTLTRNLVNCCLELTNVKLIHVSSVAAIGRPREDGISDETCGWPVKPASIYSKTKTLAELEVWRGITEGLNAVIVNPSVILGPGDWKKGSAMIFDTIRKGLMFYPGGATGFVDVSDVAEVMVALGNSELSGERYILNSADLSFRELFEKVAINLHRKPPSYSISPFMTSLAWIVEWMLTLVTKKEPRITRHSARSAHSVQSYSSEKICNALPYSFRNIDETIREIAAFYTKDKKAKE